MSGFGAIFGSVFSGFTGAFFPVVLSYFTPILTPIAAVLFGGGTGIVGVELLSPILAIAKIASSPQIGAVSSIVGVLGSLFSFVGGFFTLIVELVSLLLTIILKLIPFAYDIIAAGRALELEGN